MKTVLMILVVAGLAACDNSSKVEINVDSAAKKLDTAWNKIENAEVMDSIRAKGSEIFDSVKSKGGKLVDKAEKEFNDLKKKDSIK